MDRLAQNPSELLRIVNMAVGGLAIAGGVGSLIHHSFSSIIIGVYEVVAGALIMFLEVRSPSDRQKAMVHEYASFMHSFIGRGVFYILLGVLMLNYYTILYVCGAAIGIIGAAYVALQFVGAIEPPSTMQKPDSHDPEAQPVWQAPTE